MTFSSCISEHEAREEGVQFTTLADSPPCIFVKPQRSFNFWIRRKHGGPLEKVTIEAQSDFAAIDKLPKCVYWDLATE